MFHKESSSTSSSKGKKAKDVPLRKSDRRALRQRVSQVLYCPPDDTAVESLLDDIFLQGALVSRHIQLPDHIKATLFLRSSSLEEEVDSSVLHQSCWPYTVGAPQCVWLQLDSKNLWHDAGGKAIVVDIPALPLLSVLASPQHHDHAAAVVVIPTITAPAQVSKYLCRGAHLMRAGMRQWLVPSSFHHHHSGENNNNTNNKQQKTEYAPPQVVAVQVEGNPQPFAVGLLGTDLSGGGGDDFWTTNQGMIGVGTTGVGVTIVTCYGDDLWRQQQQPVSSTTAMMAHQSSKNEKCHTSESSPFDDGHYGNVGFCQGKYVVPIVVDPENNGDNENHCESDNEVNDLPIDSTVTEGDVVVSEAKDDISLPVGELALPDGVVQHDNCAESSLDEPAAPDALLSSQEHQPTPEQVVHDAVCRALVKIHPKSELPMLVSTFYSQHVLPNRAPGTTIELKRTKYKKLGPYLAEQVESGLLTVGPDKTTLMAFLTSYNKRHPDLSDYVAQENAESLATTDIGPRRMVLTTLYCLPNHFTSLLRLDPAVAKAEHATSEERRGTGMLTGKEMFAIVEDYIDREKLIDPTRPDMVILDGPLTDALYGKTKHADQQEETPDRLSRKDLRDRWARKMQEAFALVELPGSRIINMGRGKPPSVTIEVSKRQARKFDTRVRGLEHFGVDAPAFCKDVSHRFACSGSVEENPSDRAALPKGHVELSFQGNLANELEALLLGGDEGLSSHGGVRGSPYRLPANSLEFVLRKGVPPRKKQPATQKRK